MRKNVIDMFIIILIDARQISNDYLMKYFIKVPILNLVYLNFLKDHKYIFWSNNVTRKLFFSPKSKIMYLNKNHLTIVK